VDIPENASDRERTIHSFLDTYNVSQVNIQRFLEDKATLAASNKIKEAFETLGWETKSSSSKVSKALSLFERRQILQKQ